jgi:hypothetical protein
MMTAIKNIGVIFLLSVFLFSSMGVSILHHICNTSNTDDVTLYPEFFQMPGSSCCEGGQEDLACYPDTETTSSDNTLYFNAAPCCVSINSFLKLEMVTIRAEKLMINSFPTLVPQYFLPVPEIAAIESIKYPIHFLQFHPPPLGGKQLIHFLHQQKIPDHPSIS